MKTRKIRLIAMVITLAAVMTGVNAEAQRRETSTQRNTSKKEVRQVKESKRFNDKKAYQSNDRNKQLKSSSREYRGSDRTPNTNRSHRQYYSDRDYKPKGNAHWNKSAKYSKKQWKNHYKHDRKYAYHHPKYGNVYRQFHVNPVRIHHHTHGDYYFYGGHYYRHHYGIGYVRIEIPRHMVFNHLPFQCELVRVGPHVYYRYGDMYFERYSHGYRLAPSIGIQFSAHF
jgi:hypothetical protein